MILMKDIWNRSGRFLWTVFVVALLLRGLFVASLGAKLRFPDAGAYDTIAMNLLDGKGYTQGEVLARRPPGYPTFLAGIYALFGHNYPAVRIVQAILSALMVIFIYLTGRSVFNETVGKLGAVIAVFYPFFIFYSGMLLSDILFTFTLVLFSLLAFKLIENNSLKSQVGVGLILGVTTLIRPTICLFPIFMFVWLWMIREKKKEAIWNWLLICIIFIITLSPWMIRNYLVLNAFVPFTTQGGEHLWVSNHPAANGTGVYPEETAQRRIIMARIPSEVERDRYFRQEAIKFIVNDPGHYFKLIFMKFIRFWNPFPQTSLRDQVVSFFSYGLLLPVFIIGLILSLKNNRAWFLYLLILYFTMFHTLLSYGSTRFRFPIEPYIILFAAVGIDYLWKKRYQGLSTKRITSRRSLAVMVDILKGSIITKDLLTFLRPGSGISPGEYGQSY